jgi:prepilin-type N-terminal cleavage/methylation domain-containing protein
MRTSSRAGFTLLELGIVMVLLVIVAVKAAMLFDIAAESQTEDTAQVALEDQARRTMDQIVFAVMGANRETLFPDPESPTYSEDVQYEVSLGVQAGAVVWGDPERIALGQGSQQVVWSQNPGEPEERRVVWTNVVRPFLEGELFNGIDDNGNGLIDERGAAFERVGADIRLHLTLEALNGERRRVTRTLTTTVLSRN